MSKVSQIELGGSYRPSEVYRGADIFVDVLAKQLEIPEEFFNSSNALKRAKTDQDLQQFESWLLALHPKEGSKPLTASIYVGNPAWFFHFTSDGTFPKDIDPNSESGKYISLLLGEARLKAVKHAMHESNSTGRYRTQKAIETVQMLRKDFVKKLQQPKITFKLPSWSDLNNPLFNKRAAAKGIVIGLPLVIAACSTVGPKTPDPVGTQVVVVEGKSTPTNVPTPTKEAEILRLQEAESLNQSNKDSFWAQMDKQGEWQNVERSTVGGIEAGNSVFIFFQNPTETDDQGNPYIEGYIKRGNEWVRMYGQPVSSETDTLWYILGTSTATEVPQGMPTPTGQQSPGFEPVLYYDVNQTEDVLINGNLQKFIIIHVNAGSGVVTYSIPLTNGGFYKNIDYSPRGEDLKVYRSLVGDTIESIAARFKVTPENLLASNQTTERVKWYRPGVDEVMIGSQIRIPSSNLETKLEVEYQRVYSSAPEVDEHSKEVDGRRRFVYYRSSETNIIDKVLDLETGEIMGYDISKEGIISLTSLKIVEQKGRIVFSYEGGNIDRAIELWKKHHLKNGNPLLLTNDTPIELEFRLKTNDEDPLSRPRDWLRTGDTWIMWTSGGSLRISIFNDLLGKTEEEIGIYARYAASGDLNQTLRFTIPERLGNNRPKIQPDWFKIPSSSSPEYDLVIAGWGKTKTTENDKPRPVKFE